MISRRSFGFAAATLVAAGASTAAGLTGALGEAFGLSIREFGAVAAAPYGATSQPLRDLENAGPWLTGVPGGVQSLKGKVVVVNFWTYSCINSLRALPYLRAWSERYASKGLVVVGVHAPEFQFEHDAAKVRLAAHQLDVGYPNVQDNRYATWQRFANQGWPGFYFIGADGRIRGYRSGEGRYAEAEQFIRALLTEAGQDVASVMQVPIQGSGIEADADWANLRSPEAYFGYGKADGLVSSSGGARDASRSYEQADQLKLNRWDLEGDWTLKQEFASLDSERGRLRYRFHARDLHLVLGRSEGSGPVRFRATLDGRAPGDSHGGDVDAEGWGELREDRLYQLIRLSGPVRERTMTIEFGRSGARAYAVTFG
ncbi:MAG: redoxin domain-containing protein [Kaiparowitsia implicata GSE-PSE-MK54-09C]|jgi:thiol-disulfide isomerase/thioredoxin|nr:redoxin domain-containing protein [Kaiparowitsia implicata GSE-PSE-MK54-09C]